MKVGGGALGLFVFLTFMLLWLFSEVHRITLSIK